MPRSHTTGVRVTSRTSGEALNNLDQMVTVIGGVKDTIHLVVYATGQMFEGFSGFNIPDRKSPLLGDGGDNFVEQATRTNTWPIAIPDGVTGWELLMRVDLKDDGLGTVQDVEVKLRDNSNGLESELYHAYASGAPAATPNVDVGTGLQLLEVNGLLPPAFTAGPGELGKAQLVVTVNKTSPATSTGNGVKYWDGLMALSFRLF